ncbi:hypothetical protein GCM10022237_02930 [Nocardioides ginsengisoli]|uniref:Uncharacterized protein n=1 Tax=Nocardioides ginsengisoli TaxID=363868 RepID=A0ABW3W6E6_9ACTN
MELLVSVGTIWVAAAALFTFGVARAAADDTPFRIERERLTPTTRR